MIIDKLKAIGLHDFTISKHGNPEGADDAQELSQITTIIELY